MVPRVSKDAFPDVNPATFIDKHILAKLRRVNVPRVAVDRRLDVSALPRGRPLDVTGALPTPDEIRAFQADTKPDKRSRKIDELLARPGYAALWALKFCDILNASDYGVYADGMSQEQDARRISSNVGARALEENLPYDQFVERILTATSREGRSPRRLGGQGCLRDQRWLSDAAHRHHALQPAQDPRSLLATPSLRRRVRNLASRAQLPRPAA